MIFVLESVDVHWFVNRPSAWPSFKYYSVEINRALSSFVSCRVEFEVSSANRGVSLIAQNVTSENRLQFYVAASFPA